MWQEPSHGSQSLKAVRKAPTHSMAQNSMSEPYKKDISAERQLGMECRSTGRLRRVSTWGWVRAARSGELKPEQKQECLHGTRVHPE